MPITADTKRPFVCPITYTVSGSKSDVANIKGFALAGLLIKTPMLGATYTFEVSFSEAGDTLVPLKDKSGAAIAITYTGIGYYNFAGGLPLGITSIKLVSNTTEATASAANAKAFLVGQPVL